MMGCPLIIINNAIVPDIQETKCSEITVQTLHKLYRLLSCKELQKGKVK